METIDNQNYYLIEESTVKEESYHKINIEKSIKQSKGISITFYSLSNSIENLVKFTLYTVLEYYNKASLEHSVYNVLFEAMLNGLKANAKKLFFIEHGLDINDPAHYEHGMKLFKNNITKLNLRNASDKVKEKNLYVRVLFTHSNDGIELEIVNNTLMLPTEEARIRKKLSLGEKYSDLMSYYQDNSDPTEGEGLGLVLSLILLRAENIDPSLFRIGTKNGLTFARIEIPFTDNFISKRSVLDPPSPS